MRDAFDSDRALVRRMLSGEERAFEQFFEANFGGLYRFALLRMGNDGEAAEEVAQAALCAAVKKLTTYRGEAALFTWLCTFCRHEISAFCRKRKRAPVSFGSAEEQPWIRETLDALEDESSRLPDEVLSRKELKALVREALNRLPPHYGDALEWKYIENCPVNEIAKRMKMSPKAAESLLTRARDAFREAFTATCSGEPETEME
ncbi:MAG: sigma-70 family RNA polymerase sigma factor [Planctomycetes bacterium]|nr:sigma-70 family RNA polymerase sigma factor [Planctomycetota bacterium]